MAAVLRHFHAASLLVPDALTRTLLPPAVLDGVFSSFQHLPRHFLASHCGHLRPSQRNLLGGPAVPRENALIIFNRCQVVIEFAYTAFTAGPVGTRLAAGFTHREFHGMELVPDSAVEHLAYVAKCSQPDVNIGAVFAETLPEVALHHRAYI